VKVAIGRVGRPHGIDGSFVVERASDDARWWKVGARFLAGGEPAEVVAARRASGRPVVRLDRPVERGTLLEVDRSELPPTGEDEYYAFELIGLDVVEENGRRLGTVADVIPGVANDVLEVGEHLLPMVEDCIRSVDLDTGLITVAAGFAD
jgi:16S rRNA processing protein RimM